MRQRLLDAGTPLAAAALLGAAVGCVAVNDPTVPGSYPPCPVLTELGLHCPGCGGLRATHALAHGAFATAWHANALVVAGAALLGLGLLVWLAAALAGARRRLPAQLPFPAWLGWAVAALVAAFTVLRNLPPGAFLIP
ncbi:DUF2752 domain-containing protein [Streptomyces triticirhizae]|uniref:DUF2752 domain-containing protein n=1 Tax=Streptomyces triticirhizae TaxID=2483353 RepID=A0A3M2M1E7_9ACTN|nr:DUF2752 domain-containing protein [Streptomyces triticirhizae]RMI43534.1 DUF2752 domain-containing protein [Streptomyces triticirhizae]